MQERFLKLFLSVNTGLIIVLPLFVDPFMRHPYIFPRVLLFQILVELSMIAWLLLIRRNTSFYPQLKNPTVIGFLFYAGVLVALLLMSIDVNRSLFSTPARMMGLVTLLHCWVWFILLGSVFKTWDEWRRIFFGMGGVAALVAVYGILQFFDTPFAPRTHEFGARITSTIGNPIHFASYLLVNAFVALILFIRAKSFFVKSMLGGVIFLFAAAIILSGSRGVTFVFFIAMSALALYFFVRMRKAGIQKPLYGIAIAFVLLLLLGATAFRQGNGNDNLPSNLKRLIHISLRDTQRSALADIGLKGFFERPLAGWGQENYHAIFSTHISDQIYGKRFQGATDSFGNFKMTGGQNTIEKKWYDYSHNQFIEVLATTGSIGFLGFLVAWLAVIYTIIRAWRKAQDLKERAVYATVLAAVLAYHIQNITVFDTPVVYIAVMALLGFIVSQSSRTPSSAFVPVRHASIIPLLLTILCLGALVFGNALTYIKSKGVYQAADIIKYDFDKGFRLFQKSLQGFSFFHQYFRREYAESAIFLIKKFQTPAHQQKTILVSAIEEMRKNSAFIPYDIRDTLVLAALYRSAGKQNSAYYTQGYQLLSRSVRLYPSYRDILVELIDFSLFTKEYSRALEFGDTLAQIAPGIGETYWTRSRIFLDAGKYKKMFQELAKAATLYPIYRDNSSWYIALASKVPLEYAKEALLHINKAIQTYPNASDYRVARVLVFVRSNRARDAATDIEWLRAQDPQALELVEKMLKKMGPDI